MTVGSYCTMHTFSSLNCDLVAKNVYFSTPECGCYIFLTQKLCLYFNTQGLCVSELLFRGFWLNDCCVTRKKNGEIQLALLCFLLFYLNISCTLVYSQEYIRVPLTSCMKTFQGSVLSPTMSVLKEFEQDL